MSDEGIGTVAVIGAGAMGAGIAQVFAEKGFETRLFDPYPESLERGINQIEDFWRKGIERGKTTIEDKENWSRNLSYEGELEKTTSDADLIIEAAPENLDLKKGIFSELDKIAKPEAILASNTSSLSIGVLADGLSQPGRVIGMHFFNPVPLMTLLEIVRHDKNDQHIIETIRKIGLSLIHI